MVSKVLFMKKTNKMSKQITDTILMVRPANFGFNTETAVNNAFQAESRELTSQEVATKAKMEFDSLVEKLKAVGITVIVIEDTADPIKKDAIFPNNWFTTHSSGAIITYPMFAPIRRLERREDIITLLEQQFHYNNRIHLEGYETQGDFLEGTGSIILDRDNRLLYACKSIRTHEGILDELCQSIGFEKVIFDALDKSDFPIYHTNVMMAMGATFCVICMDSIKNKAEHERVTQKLTSSGKEIINISFEQMNSFAGNMLHLRGAHDETYLVMSTQAYESLNKDQIEQVEKHTKLLHSSIRTIEYNGGGSVRCMIAEIFPTIH